MLVNLFLFLTSVFLFCLMVLGFRSIWTSVNKNRLNELRRSGRRHSVKAKRLASQYFAFAMALGVGISLLGTIHFYFEVLSSQP